MIEVVAGAVFRDGRVLAARRARPPELAGRWEFPGGKVESGEDGPVALARELGEELGVEVAVGARLAEATDERVRLTLYSVLLVAGVPCTGHDHDALRWVVTGELIDLDWLPLDRALLGAVTAQLSENRGDRPGA